MNWQGPIATSPPAVQNILQPGYQGQQGRVALEEIVARFFFQSVNWNEWITSGKSGHLNLQDLQAIDAWRCGCSRTTCGQMDCDHQHSLPDWSSGCISCTFWLEASGGWGWEDSAWLGISGGCLPQCRATEAADVQDRTAFALEELWVRDATFIHCNQF